MLSADERADRVLLRLTESDRGLLSCPHGGPAGPTVGIVAVLLQSPLGDRTLADAVTGQPVAYLAENDLMRPVPPLPGWDVSTPMADVTTRMAYFGGPGAAVAVENFSAVDADGRYGQPGSLAIVQVTHGGWHPPPSTRTSPVTVRGHPGLAAPGIIVWTESGRTIAVVAAYPTGRPSAPVRYPVMLPAPTQPLSTDQLLAIAATLTGGHP